MITSVNIAVYMIITYTIGISASGNRHYYNSSVQPQLYTQLNCYNNYYTNRSYCNSNEVCQNCSGNEMAIKCEFGKLIRL